MPLAHLHSPQCVRCRINDVQCQWPQPQKRGPPKHYTATIEKRLIDTEAILLALMSQVSDEQLMSAYDHLQQDMQPSANLDEPSDAGNRHGLTRKDKAGPVYWTNYPLNSAEDARRWWADRMSTAANETPSRQYEAIDHALIDTNVAILVLSLRSLPGCLSRSKMIVMSESAKARGQNLPCQNIRKQGQASLK
ncbi:hypothetical protein FALCPG4_007431 [Fusarium falciforme]